MRLVVAVALSFALLAIVPPATAECTDVGSSATACESSYGTTADARAANLVAVGASEYRYSFFGDTFTIVSGYARTNGVGGARTVDLTVGCTDQPGGSNCDVILFEASVGDASTLRGVALYRRAEGTYLCTVSVPNVADGCKKFAGP